MRQDIENETVEDVKSELEARMMDCLDDKEQTREELMEQIKAYNFAVIELAEYLNTHPDDEKALCLHNSYCKTLKDLKDKYQKVYGPLSIYYPCNKWRWLEEPCPWFILEYCFFKEYNTW